MPLDATLIAKVLADAGIDHELEQVAVLGPVLRLGVGDAPAALRALKECSHTYSFLVDLFGIDTGEAVDVAYHLRSFVYDEEVHLRVRQPYGSTMASVWEVYPAALTAERECAEMFGLLLSGHPNPKRLLTTEGSPAWLLKQTAIRSVEEVRNR